MTDLRERLANLQARADHAAKKAEALRLLSVIAGRAALLALGWQLFVFLPLIVGGDL